MFAAILAPIPSAAKSFGRWLTQGYEMNSDFEQQLGIGMMDYKPMKGQKTIIAKTIPDKDLRKLEMPVMILFGSRCVIYDLKKAIKKAITLLRCVKIEIMPDCAHSLNMEQVDLVNTFITQFLRGDDNG